ncbi:MAG: zinc-dependent metalloprotease [Thermoleophilaceae bacterium]
MVDWSLARQVARLAAGAETGPVDLGVDLVALSSEMQEPVASFTGLEPEGPVPAGELLSRTEWASVNLDNLAEMLDPVAARLDKRLDFAGPLAGALRLGAGATLAAEAGLVLGYASTRVLGQFELSLLPPERPPRLLYVAPNLARAVRELDVDRDSFFGWIAIHELTHAFQFQGVGWLRDHLRGLMREYLETVEVRIDSGAAGGLPSLPRPAEFVEAFREGGLAALVQTREQRDLMNRLQAAMAVIEGYAEYVMDALGPKLLPAYEGLREAMERRRRSRSTPERILGRLLGLDLKMRQYELGRAFCEAVANEGGMEALNRVWESPEALPDLGELDRPPDWVARTAPAPSPA